MNKITFAMSALALSVLVGCGGNTNQAPQPALSVTISPQKPTLGAKGTQVFQAVVSGTDLKSQSNVSWRLVESGGGSISTEGSQATYTAPLASGTYHLVATSTAEGAASATATITVVNGTAVQLDHTSISVGTSGTFRFHANVIGTADTDVTWAVTSPNSGSIDATGLYTAPSANGTATITATSTFDPSRSAAATIHIVDPSSWMQVAISPSGTISMLPGASRQLTATALYGATPNVLWSIDEGSTGGTISPAGLYTAPISQGQFHVVASAADDVSVQTRLTIQVVGSNTLAGHIDYIDPDPSDEWRLVRDPYNGTHWALYLDPDALYLKIVGPSGAEVGRGYMANVQLQPFLSMDDGQSFDLTNLVSMSPYGVAFGVRQKDQHRLCVMSALPKSLTVPLNGDVLGFGIHSAMPGSGINVGQTIPFGIVRFGYLDANGVMKSATVKVGKMVGSL